MKEQEKEFIEAGLVSKAAFENHPADRLHDVEARNFVLTRSALVLTAKGILPASLFDNLPRAKRFQMYLLGFGSMMRNWPSPLPANSNFYHIFNIWGTGYHHWLTEVAPKLFLFEEALRRNTILLPEIHPRFVAEFLELFHFDNLYTYSGNVFGRKLRVISNPYSGNYNPAHITLLRDRVLDKLQTDTRQEGLRIYISRKNSRGRRVANEDELESVLRNNGFLILELEDVSFSDQVELFASCDFLISIHGAALTNMIFMNKGSRIIELYPSGFSDQDYFNACYRRLGKVLGMYHSYLFCERESPTGKFHLDTNDIIVDPTSLIESIMVY